MNNGMPVTGMRRPTLFTCCVVLYAEEESREQRFLGGVGCAQEEEYLRFLGVTKPRVEIRLGESAETGIQVDIHSRYFGLSWRLGFWQRIFRN